MSFIRLSCLLPGEKALRLARSSIVVTALLGVMPLRGSDTTSAPPSLRDTGVLPEPITEENFAALKSHSPFLRSVGFSDSLVLTGVARIADNVYATLLDTGTMESHVVSETANHQGWQLVGVRGDEADLESLTAKIQVTGGEVVSIRYEKLPAKSAHGKPGSGSHGGSTQLSSSQLKQAKDAAVNYRGENPADGYPKLPPPEVVEKLSRMSVPQRETINREMIELRNRGLGLQERARIYTDKIDRAVRGR